MTAASILAAGALTWPLPTLMATHTMVPWNHQDLQVSLWWQAAVARWLAGDGPLGWRPELVWPDGQQVWLYVWNCLVQVLFAPVRLLVGPVLTSNTTLLAILVTNGVAAGLAVRALTGNGQAALLAAVAATAAPQGVGQAMFGRYEQAALAPALVYLFALLRLGAEPGRRRWLLLAALSLAVAGAVYWFEAVFLGTLTALAAVVRAAAASGRHRRLRLSPLRDPALVGLSALLLASPFLAPLAAAWWGDPGAYEQARLAHSPLAGIQVSMSLQVPADLLGALGGPTDVVCRRLSFVVLPVLLLATLRRETRLLGLLGLVAGALALGPLLAGPAGPLQIGGSTWLLPTALLDRLPVFDRLFWPDRWTSVSVSAAALALGLLAAPLARGLRGALLVLLLGGASFADGWLLLRGGDGGLPIRGERFPLPEVFSALAEMEGERPVLTYPLGDTDHGTLAWQSVHRQPIAAGLSWSVEALRPPAWHQRVEAIPLWRALDRLATTGEVEARTEPWTLADTGGYHTVLFPLAAVRRDPQPEVDAISELLGCRPYLREPHVAVWAIPSVGKPPRPWLREEPEQQPRRAPPAAAGHR